MMSDSVLVQTAMHFAMDAHRNQLRKYTGEPYVVHLAEVVGYSASAVVTSSTMLAVAWLHDTIEDCDVCEATMRRTFGGPVFDGVMWLTDKTPVWGNRAKRKQEQRARLADAPSWVQSIKCADMISNTPSIAKHDPEFAPVYVDECVQLLDVLQWADPQLRLLAAARLQAAAVQYDVPANLMDAPRHA